MDHEPHPLSGLQALRASIAESEADLAAGRVVPAGPVLERMREAIRLLEARLEVKLGTAADV